MAADRAWSVLLVDTEAGFVDDTKGLLSDHAVHTARNMSDAQRRLVEETIDVAIVGPGYGRTDAGARDHQPFRAEADASR